MQRKLFLSFLGTNNYVECNYYDEEDPSNRVEGVKYVQEALTQMYCKEIFGPEDCYYLFLTTKARQMNWEDNGQWNNKTSCNDLPNEGLSGRLAQLNLPGEIKDIEIPEGFSSEEIWEIFERVFSCMQEGDEVFFDITHAFRSLPLLGMVLLNYSKALKKIQVKGIFYGAFEKLGPASEVKKMPMETRNAPVLNLLSVSELQDWTNAAFDFINYGKVSRLAQMSRERAQAVLRKTIGESIEARQVNQISKIIEPMALAIATNRGKEIFNKISFDRLKSLLNDFSKSKNFVPPLNAIMEELAEKIAPFQNNDPLHWLMSAKWCAGHGMYQQGITQLQEGLLTWLCLKLEQQDPFFHWRSKEARDLISAAFNVVGKNESKWYGKAKAYADRCRKLVQDEMILSVMDSYRSLTGLRNDINHGGYIGTTKADTFKTKLGELIQQVEDIVKGKSTAQPIQHRDFLLNLSNHPTSSWTEAQLAEAKKLFGEVSDMPFPAVPPDIGEKEFQHLVDQYFQKIIEQAPSAVHIMGEMTFTCRMVGRLKEAGITCIASTTERIVEERGGKKIVEFRFVKFRKY